MPAGGFEGHPAGVGRDPELIFTDFTVTGVSMKNTKSLKVWQKQDEAKKVKNLQAGSVDICH